MVEIVLISRHEFLAWKISLGLLQVPEECLQRKRCTNALSFSPLSGTRAQDGRLKCCESVVKLTMPWQYVLVSLWTLFTDAHTECSYYFNAKWNRSATFASPWYPELYSPGLSCFYIFQGEQWDGIHLHFTDFQLEPPYSAGCLTDFVSITTVSVTGLRTDMGRFCGNSTPPSFITMQPRMELQFVTNGAQQFRGFQGVYEFINEAVVTPAPSSICGGVMSGPGGVIESPNYPQGFDNNLDCTWLIRVPYHQQVYVKVEHLQFLGSLATCRVAELSLHDGYGPYLPSGPKLLSLCGDLRYYKSSSDRTLLSDRNRLVVRFMTGSFTPTMSPGLRDDSNAVGFRLTWTAVDFQSLENCTTQKRFVCSDSRFCLHRNRDSSTCDLRYFCLDPALYCDGIVHCEEGDLSDERNCHAHWVATGVIVGSIGIITAFITSCWRCKRFWHKLLLARCQTPSEGVYEVDLAPPLVQHQCSCPKSSPPFPEMPSGGNHVCTCPEQGNYCSCPDEDFYCSSKRDVGVSVPDLHLETSNCRHVGLQLEPREEAFMKAVTTFGPRVDTELW